MNKVGLEFSSKNMTLSTSVAVLPRPLAGSFFLGMAQNILSNGIRRSFLTLEDGPFPRRETVYLVVCLLEACGWALNVCKVWPVCLSLTLAHFRAKEGTWAAWFLLWLGLWSLRLMVSPGAFSSGHCACKEDVGESKAKSLWHNGRNICHWDVGTVMGIWAGNYPGSY